MGTANKRARRFTKGDKPGHPFRGNQWKTGVGGTPNIGEIRPYKPKTTQDTGTRPTPNSEYRAFMSDVIAERAEILAQMATPRSPMTSDLPSLMKNYVAHNTAKTVLANNPDLKFPPFDVGTEGSVHIISVDGVDRVVVAPMLRFSNPPPGNYNVDDPRLPEILDNLNGGRGDVYSFANHIVREWANTSNKSELAQQIQDSAGRLFGTEIVPHSQIATSDFVMKPEPGHEAVDQQMLDAVLKAQYDNTQAMFAEAGITEMTIYRGMSFEADGKQFPSPPEWSKQTGEASIPLRPLSSWAASVSEARQFASVNLIGVGVSSVMVSAVVPVSRIFSTPATGNGCLDEKEVVLIGGGKNDVYVTAGQENVQNIIKRDYIAAVLNTLNRGGLSPLSEVR